MLRQRTEKIEDLRNAVQHLNHEIDNLVGLDLPIWGVLSWFAVSDPDRASGSSCSLRAGTLFTGKDLPVVNPLEEAVEHPVDLITLRVYGHSVNLSDAMRRVEQLTKSIEEQLEEQFSSLPQSGGDLLICLELQFGTAESNEAT